ncbi:MAG: hypothetical protein HYR85_06355 [Planctomycetes bacterium]|nr:hypothetical protein [Planctomycetota bacterium]MBI3843051.1 hypothetical protein [Planctomycetota bacterium]
MDGELNVSGIDGYGKDFLNRRRGTKRETSAEDAEKKEREKNAAKLSNKAHPKPQPPMPGDALVDFLA